MDKQQVLELARQAGIEDCGGFACNLPADGLTMDSLLAFAELVAKAEREACAIECDRMQSVMDENAADLVRRVEALEKWRDDHCRNMQRMPGMFSA